MKRKIYSTIITILILSGLSLLLYPTVSDYLNNISRARDISTYAESVAHTDKEKYQKMWDEAVDYNTRLSQMPTHWRLGDKEKAEYTKTLDVSGTGIMSYIEIPKLSCSLPVYHSTDTDVLQIAIGHLEGSSLPVGGKSTHTVLSGHRGLPSAKLFTSLDKLVEGDVFSIRTLDETLSYEVDKISIVLPAETELLQIVPGEDLCTLMTCTPYGVNSHRLLVRGHRIDNEKGVEIRVTADALQIDPMMVAPVLAMPVVIILFIIVITHKKKMKSDYYA
ncbi:MAG: class C sortase [Ruminococcus sp.]|nr:class C sortase [Ruminococcus sp.]